MYSSYTGAPYIANFDWILARMQISPLIGTSPLYILNLMISSVNPSSSNFFLY